MVSYFLPLLLTSSWILHASASENELERASVVYPQVSCRDYGYRKEFPVMSKNFTECLDACDAAPWCNVVQMQCGTTCVLHGECSTTKLSGCDSYLAKARHREYALQSSVEIMNKAILNPWAGILFVHILSVCWTCAVTDHIVQEEEDYHHYELVHGGDIFSGVNRGDLHAAANLEGTCARKCCVIFAYLVLLLVLSTSFFPFNHDMGGGFCSLVGNDGQPIMWYQMFTGFLRRVVHIHAERDFQYQDGGVIHEGIEFMPLSCWDILNSDLVRNDTGLDCKSWCHKHIGWLPRPMCGLVPTYGAVFRTCLKVEAWDIYEFLMQVIPLSNFQRCWLIGFIFGGLSFLVGYRNASDNTTKDTRPPSRERCEEDSPYGGRSILHCWGRPSSDYQASRRQLQLSMLILLEPVFDINTFMVFFSHGQLQYALVLLVATLAPNIHDPLQANHVELFLTSYKRGFFLKGFYIVSKRDGAWQATVTFVVAIHALMRQSYYGYATWSMYLSIGLSALSSVIISIPAASISRDMLMSDLDFNDFYQVENIKRRIGTRTWLATFNVLGFGIAVARTFSSNTLVVKLYLLGLGAGMVQFLCYDFFIKREVPHAPKVLRYTLAFIFWPLAITRLLADDEVYNGMRNGTCRLSDAVLYGAASLPPILFHTHHISSLVLFWMLAYLDRPDFFVVLLRKIQIATAQGTLLQLHNFQCLFVVVMLLIGWLSIIASGALFYRHRKHFQLIHETSKKSEKLRLSRLM